MKFENKTKTGPSQGLKIRVEGLVVLGGENVPTPLVDFDLMTSKKKYWRKRCLFVDLSIFEMMIFGSHQSNDKMFIVHIIV